MTALEDAVIAHNEEITKLRLAALKLEMTIDHMAKEYEELNEAIKKNRSLTADQYEKLRDLIQTNAKNNSNIAQQVAEMKGKLDVTIAALTKADIQVDASTSFGEVGTIEGSKIGGS